MEQISAAANRALARSNESSERPAVAQSDLPARVWQALTQMYGAAFPAAYGDTPPKLWMHAICGLREQEIRDGLALLAKQPREYPPNLTQFVGACRPPKQVRFLGTPTTPEQLQKQLPAQKAPVSVAERWLAEMRKTVGV